MEIRRLVFNASFQWNSLIICCQDLFRITMRKAFSDGGQKDFLPHTFLQDLCVWKAGLYI
jgi:hypothetical protein